MRVLILGIDGYLGWPLALHLLRREHTVLGLDDLSRRRNVKEMGSDSIIPISDVGTRRSILHHVDSSAEIDLGSTISYGKLAYLCRKFQPECVVHLAEIPSAPYSMMDWKHAEYVQRNNVVGTLLLLHAIYNECPKAHLLKLGTMGEYGTPNCYIPEGYFPEESYWQQNNQSGVEVSGGIITGMLFPRRAGSWYHLSKVHDTHNIEFACRNWGLCSTDIMQGVVYGTQIDAMRNDPQTATRFDVDECFGTVINRFCTQAVAGMFITPYGSGQQKRGFLPLRDSIQCLTLALENPPQPGEYRTFNQFADTYSIAALAAAVQIVAAKCGIDAQIEHIENPRKESEDHYYQPHHQGLFDLGYKPQGTLDDELFTIIRDIIPHQQRLERYRHTVSPRIGWDGTNHKRKPLS